MISYSVDTEPRRKIYVTIALLSLGLASWASLAVKILGLPYLAPTAFAIFPLLEFVYSNLLWKIPPFSLFSGIPNISGTWKGEVHRQLPVGSEEEKIPCTVLINQTWQRIEMVLESDRTQSTLEVAGFSVSNSQFKWFTYLYRVEYFQEGLNKNLAYGTCRMRLTGEKTSDYHLEGRFSTDYPACGYLVLDRSSKNKQSET